MIEKEKKIKEEIERLTSSFSGMSEKSMNLLAGPIEEASFMKVMLIELKETIQSEGATDLFVQGSSKYIRESPAMKTYNSLIKNYTTIMKNIIDKFLKSDAEFEQYEAGASLRAFLNDGPHR